MLTLQFCNRHWFKSNENNILQYSHIKLPKLFYNYTDLLLSQVNKISLKGNSKSIGSEKSLKSVISQLAFWISVESSGGSGSANFSNTLRLSFSVQITVSQIFLTSPDYCTFLQVDFSDQWEHQISDVLYWFI